MHNKIKFFQKLKNGETSSVIFNFVVILLLLAAIICDAVSIFASIQRKALLATVMLIISTGILTPALLVYKDEVKLVKSLKGINQFIIVLVLVLVGMDATAAGFKSVSVLLPDKPVYDFSTVTEDKFDILFLKEQDQSELSENIQQSLLLIEPLESYGIEYLNTRVGYADLAPKAEKNEELMLLMIDDKKQNTLKESYDTDFLEKYYKDMDDIYEQYGDFTPDGIMKSIYSFRGDMDKECITVENRNCYFEDALSSATNKFRSNYKEDYIIAARYVWATLYASVGLDSFTEAEIDKVIRVYTNMLDSHEFDEYKDNIKLIISALELIKADTSFIQGEIVEMMANNN